MLPVLQLRQAAKASNPGLVPGILIGWACTYDVAALIYAASSSSRRTATGYLDREAAIDAFARADTFAGISMLIYVTAAALGIAMVHTLTKYQRWTVEDLAAGCPSWAVAYDGLRDLRVGVWPLHPGGGQPRCAVEDVCDVAVVQAMVELYRGRAGPAAEEQRKRWPAQRVAQAVQQRGGRPRAQP